MKGLLFIWKFAVVALALSMPSIAAAQGAETGSIEIRSADSVLVDGVYRVSARVQYILPDEIRDALDNGLPVAVELDFTIIAPRRFWLDAEAAELTVAYELRYNALSKRYILRNVNTGQQTTYATIFAALNVLGTVDSLPLIDASLLDEGRRYRIRMRAVMSIPDYPVSLRYLLFWRDDWRLSSSWFSWSLDR